MLSDVSPTKCAGDVIWQLLNVVAPTQSELEGRRDTIGSMPHVTAVSHAAQGQ